MGADTSGGGVTESVSLGVYPLEAVMAAAYVFVDRCYVLLDQPEPGRVTVAFRPKGGVGASAAEVSGEFANELLAQTLRRKIAQRTASVREMVVNRALYSAAPAPAGPAGAGAAEDDLDFLDDPLGIAVPWEEKYGKKGG